MTFKFNKPAQLFVGVHNKRVFRRRELIARREATLEANAGRFAKSDRASRAKASNFAKRA
jgi:hypothetical protein